MTAERSRTDDLSRWIIPARGEEQIVRVEAPVDIPGWGERPWANLRPLTHEEALRRESIGWREEYAAVDAGGATLPATDTALVRQVCDHWALAQFDYEHCVLSYCLPRYLPDGTVEPVRGNGRDWGQSREVFRRLPPALAQWLRAAIDEVNRRTPVDAEVLAQAKKR
jgi:hypothetical protein